MLNSIRLLSEMILDPNTSSVNPDCVDLNTSGCLELLEKTQMQKV
jgi:hypothetical protein